MSASPKKKPILTIGMANVGDYSGVWFTMQAIQMYHSEVFEELEFIVLDNASDPWTNPHSKTLADYMKGHYRANGRYMAIGPRQSTSLRNLIVHAANTEYVMVVDSHIMLVPGSLKRLVRYLHRMNGLPDMFQGPLVSESGSIVGTHMNPAFRGENFGTWGVMGNCKDDNEEPFLIPGHGMGLWVCRRDNWPGYHIGYRAFGGEELIIHEKYRLAGMNTWCLPFLKWVHRFGHVGGSPYTNTAEEKYRNFLIGFQEIGLPTTPVEQYFGNALPESKRSIIRADVDKIFPRGAAKLPDGYVPFLGYPLRINDYFAKDKKTGDYPLDSSDYTPFEKPIYASTQNLVHNADLQPAAKT